MLTRREMQRRIALSKEAGVPIVNYGLVLAMANGVGLEGLEGLGGLGGLEGLEGLGGLGDLEGLGG